MTVTYGCFVVALVIVYTLLTNHVSECARLPGSPVPSPVSCTSAVSRVTDPFWEWAVLCLHRRTNRNPQLATDLLTDIAGCML